MAASQIVPIQLPEAIINYRLHCLRHQTAPPVIPAEHIADLPPLQPFIQSGSRVTWLQTQRADYLSVFPAFQGKGLPLPNKHLQNGPGFLYASMGLPSSHLPHTIHPGIFIQILQIRHPPGAQNQPWSLYAYVRHIYGRIHMLSSCKLPYNWYWSAAKIISSHPSDSLWFPLDSHSFTYKEYLAKKPLKGPFAFFLAMIPGLLLGCIVISEFWGRGQCPHRSRPSRRD